jgi:uncharacterized protein
MHKRKKRIIIWSIILILLVILILFVIINKSQTSNNGYPKDYLNRPKPEYQMTLKETRDSIDIYSLNFKSKPFMDSPALIYGLLFMPKDKENIPGIVMLPGGGVAKEGFTTRAIDLAKSGYAVLVIDQRGIGQTGGDYPSMQQDYEIFASGKEPIQHLSVYDSLVASDVLRDLKEVNKKNIGIIGESMGGRYAIISTALDKKLKGVIVISSSGFNFQDESQPYTPYLLSIDPDQYVSKISPRPILMLQGDNDSIVKLEDAQHTFSLAKEPKRFFIAQGCGHGYCDKMPDEFKKDLKILFEE